MVDENDGIEETLARQLSVVVVAADRVAQDLQRTKQEALRTAKTSDAQVLKQLQRRFRDQRQKAFVTMENAYNPKWWEEATPDQIGHLYQVACTWADEDPAAARARRLVETQLRSRYGLDIHKDGLDPAQLRARAERARGQSAKDDRDAKVQWRLSGEDSAESRRWDEQAEWENRQHEQSNVIVDDENHSMEDYAARHKSATDQAAENSGIAYDSAERRAAVARSLKSSGLEQQLVETRIRADISQAQPATEAIHGGVGRGNKARRPKQLHKAARVKRTGPRRT